MEKALLKYVCGVVINVRDEEKYIRASLLSLINQTVTPFVVVVNDGSMDRTKEVASDYADIVIDLPRHEESWAGRPELARVINAGLSVLRNIDLDFIMFSGGEAIYSPKYIEEITKRMRKDNVTIASGVAEGEPSRSFSPRGCGRLVDAEWFKSIGFKYPENYGFEAYLIYKALSQGRKVTIYPDLRFKLQRKTQLYRGKVYLWGKGMRALNYNFLYVLGRALIFSLKSPSNGFALLRGYFSIVEKYRDIEGFVSAFQRKQFLSRIREVLKNDMLL
jgi:glycosyltransferase involved in cell wall biosynthesis